MNRTVRLVAAVALLLSAGPAPAFVRETTTPGNPATGLCLWWRSRQVTFRVNTTGTTAVSCSGAAAEAAVAAGFGAWNGATRPGEATSCSDFRFVKGPAANNITAVADDGVNLVVFRQGRCSDSAAFADCRRTKDEATCAAIANCWRYGPGIIGLTTNWFDPDTGEIRDSDMELFAWDGTTPPLGSYFTCQDPSAPACDSNPPYGVGCNRVDVQAVVTHEAGHVLGLDHVCSNNPADRPEYRVCPGGSPIMKPTVGDVSSRALDTDDVAGVCAIYPRGAATLTCASSTPSEGPAGGGCATGGEAGGLVGLIAAAFGASRLRRRRA